MTTYHITAVVDTAHEFHVGNATTAREAYTIAAQFLEHPPLKGFPYAPEEKIVCCNIYGYGRNSGSGYVCRSSALESIKFLDSQASKGIYYD